jgi:GxxExxY protein
MDINELTYSINGAVFEVNRILGSGFLEKVYENALVVELQKLGISVETQVPIKVHYKDNIIGDYIADILVEGKVIVELKTVEKIERIHEAQVLNYLKATGIQVGLLVNFRNSRAEIRRLVLNFEGKEEAVQEI